MITHAGTPAGTLTLTATPASTGTPVGGAAVRPGPAPVRTLRVTGAGAWELAVDDGERTARVPFVVTGRVTPPPEKAVHAGFAAAGVLLLVALVVAVRARRTWWAALPGAGVVAGVAVAVTGAVLSASQPLPPKPGIQVDATGAGPYDLARPPIADYSRPPAQLALAYRPGDLSLTLTDASTGLPVDDLVLPFRPDRGLSSLRGRRR